MTTSPITWSTSDLAHVVLSAGNLVATNDTVAHGAVRGTNPIASGFYYWEVAATSGWSNGIGCGIADAGVAIASIAAADGGAGTAWLDMGAVPGGDLIVNGTILTNVGFYNAADRVGVCFDVDRQLLYFRDNSVDPIYGWNGSAYWNGSASANPATNAGGISTASVWGASGVTVFGAMAFVSGATNAQQVTLHSSLVDFRRTPPAGFLPLGGTWDPTSIDPNITLSNGNATALVAAGATLSNTALLGTVAMVTGGKYYFEIGWDEYGGTDSNGLSVCKAAYSHQFVAVPDGRIFDYTGGTHGSIGVPLYLNGLRVGVAVDLVNNELWFSVIGADPSSGEGGIPVAAIATTGTFAPLALLYGNADQISAIFSSLQGAFTGTIPAGAAAWPGTYQPETFDPPNVGYSVVRRINFGTRLATLATGRRFRAPNRQYPTYKYTLTFEVLPSSSTAYQGAGAALFQYAAGFYNDQQGPFLEWLYKDILTPDYHVDNGLVGYGDGVATQFPFARAWRNTYEPVGWVNLADVSNVSVGGTTQSSGWSVTQPNILTFAAPPAAGQPITATFDYYWRCSFSDDSIELEEFMSELFDLKELSFETLPSAVASPLS